MSEDAPAYNPNTLPMPKLGYRMRYKQASDMIAEQVVTYLTVEPATENVEAAWFAICGSSEILEIRDQDDRTLWPQHAALPFDPDPPTTHRATPTEPSLTIDELVALSYDTALDHGWWGDRDDPDPINVGEKLMLMVSEISEALEEWRNGHELTDVYYGDDGKPEGVPIELADVLIRIGDFCGRAGIDLDAAVRDKMVYNNGRPHRHGNKRA